MKTTTPTLTEYISLRTTELDKFEKSLREKIVWLSNERESLKRIASVANETATSGFVAPLEIELNALIPQQDRTRAKAGTMKMAILDALADQPAGLTAVHLLPIINDALGTDYVRSSLSPQLSRLKKEGKVILVDGIWMLFARNEKPSDENSVSGTSEGFDSDQPHTQGRKAVPGGGP